MTYWPGSPGRLEPLNDVRPQILLVFSVRWRDQWACRGYASGEAEELPLRPVFDRRIKLEFHCVRITSDSGMLACRELDDAFGLPEVAITQLFDGRRGKNTRHNLGGLFRQSVFGRVVGDENVNDAQRLAPDPTMRANVGREGLDPAVTSSSQIGRLETAWLANRC